MGCEGCRDGHDLGFAIRAAFQPIVDLETGKVFAYEALVRGPEGQGAGWVLGQVDDDNRYRFDQACRVAAITEAVTAGLLDTDARLSINFLPNAVYSPQACIRLTLATAREQQLPTSRLMFEFTEGEKLDAAHVRNIVESYRFHGFTTAIDDFGAGYAGLNLLAEIQPDCIKLDMELVRGIGSHQPRRLIVASMVRLARAMGIRLVAEGIETHAELATLRQLGVRYVQGYLIARPALGALPVPDPAALQQAYAA
ncbi:EAL domain-containing protein [Croceibacterium sp. TMG7-5b_MA50]|uniref:EAL domain-containing protein n=1 Tax=Croceibacterium sp. TMG7-5b_MA50 TaxID=3121290 RepID=UPI003222022B